VLAATLALGCMPSAATVANPALVQAGTEPLAVADALEALVAVKADTPGDRRYAYERVQPVEPKTAAAALGRAIVAGRLAQVSGLAAPGLVKEVERYARQSAVWDPSLRHGAAQRLLGTLYVNAPASLLEHGDSETGLELLEGVVKRFPEHAPNRQRLAEGYVALGDPEPAREHLCFASAHQNELRPDERRLLADLTKQAHVDKCP